MNEIDTLPPTGISGYIASSIEGLKKRLEHWILILLLTREGGRKAQKLKKHRNIED